MDGNIGKSCVVDYTMQRTGLITNTAYEKNIYSSALEPATFL